MKNCLKSGKCNGCGKINVTVSYSSPYSSGFCRVRKAGKGRETVFQLTRAMSGVLLRRKYCKLFDPNRKENGA